MSSIVIHMKGVLQINSAGGKGMRELSQRDLKEIYRGLKISIYDEEYVVPVDRTRLSSTEESTLASIILRLRHDDRYLLLHKYYFNLDNETIEFMMKLDEISGRLHYLNEILCNAIGLSEGSYLHEETLKNVCGVVMDHEMAETMASIESMPDIKP